MTVDKPVDFKELNPNQQVDITANIVEIILMWLSRFKSVKHCVLIN